MEGKAERSSRWKCHSMPWTPPLMRPRVLPVDEGGADRARFERALQQAKSRIRQERQTDLAHHLLTLLENMKQRPDYPERMAIKENGRIVYVKTDSIEWVEAEGNYVRIHAGKNSYLQLGAIGGLEAQLDPKKFRRIHRGTIVNIDCIRELQPWFNGCYRVILQSGVELSLSRG